MRDKPRVCLVSLRGVNSHAAWCSNYEFEDVICAVDDVDVLSIERDAHFEARRWLARRLIWRRGLRRVIPHFNPGVRRVRLERDYDLFVFVCMNPADLIYLSAVEDWHRRAHRKICFMVEFYSELATEYSYHLHLLNRFDCVSVCFAGSVDAVQSEVGRPCIHVPLGVDVMRFSPLSAAPSRCIDVYSMGRRPDSMHQALLTAAGDKGLFYIYDTLPGDLIRPRDHRQHRNLVASCAQRAKLFVAYPAKVDVAEETRGQSEPGARYFEGAAAGAVLIGQAPSGQGFARDFDWEQPVVDLGESSDSVRDVLEWLLSDPERIRQWGLRNAIRACERFDWSSRWASLLECASMQPLNRLAERREGLSRMASAQSKTPD